MFRRNRPLPQIVSGSLERAARAELIVVDGRVVKSRLPARGRAIFVIDGEVTYEKLAR